VTLLTVSGLGKSFHGFAAVANVSFAVAEGEILGLIGPNGSGKSTIFNCIAGMHKPTAGSIVFVPGLSLNIVFAVIAGGMWMPLGPTVGALFTQLLA
jgi:ABC-type branched-subunit amino acid transport system ATPase component